MYASNNILCALISIKEMLAVDLRLVLFLCIG